MEKEISKEQQDLAWKCLPKEGRDQIKEFYQSEYCNRVADELFDTVFGYHNLTSDTEPEEVLTILRKDIIEEFNQATADLSRTGNLEYKGKRELLKNLFGDKCVPDKTPEEKAKEIVDTIKDDIDNPIQMPETMLNSKSKFKVGDLALVKEGYAKGSVITIKAINIEPPISYKSDIRDDGIAQWFLESMLEPYTEESIPQNSSENCDKENLNSKSENMEAKELIASEAKDEQKEAKDEEKELNRKALYNALCELESASVKVRKALISM